MLSSWKIKSYLPTPDVNNEVVRSSLKSVVTND